MRLLELHDLIESAQPHLERLPKRTYSQRTSAVFFKTDEVFGGLSNMASGYPLFINGIRILSSEALYQACRFPHLPEAQRKIIAQTSPMTAKMVSKPYREQSRPDWERVRVKIMRWCLRVKLAQNRQAFGALLLETGDLPIVEKSFKDEYWGAKPTYADMLVGMNVLGRLLMELREELKSEQFDNMAFVEPPAIPDFLLDGQPIGQIAINTSGQMSTTSYSLPSTTLSLGGVGESVQPSLFSNMPLNLPAAETPAVPSAAGVTSTLQPYPTYQDSGIDWLGKIPTHWQVEPGLAVYREKQIKNIGLKEKQVLSLSYGRIIIKPVEKLRGLVPESFETYQIIEPSDIIIRSTDLQNDKTSLRVGLVKDKGIITSAYLCLRMTGLLHSDYAFQQLRAYDLLKVFYGMGSGLRQNLSYTDFKRMPVLVPPQEEQAVIVRFLDHANHKITRYIHAKKKLIKLLNEQKQVIIHKAVTRGLDPNVPLKPSGIEWLGDIPAHWEVRRVKQVCNAIIDCKNRTPDLVDGGAFTVVRTTNVRRGEFNPLGSYQTDKKNYDIWTQRGAPQEGDIFFTREAPVGEACLVPEQGNLCMGQRMMYFRPNKSILNPTFLLHSLYGPVAKTYIDQACNGSTVGHLRLGQVSSIPILWCPISEQIEIIKQIDIESTPLNTTISRLKREIGLMEEYRTRLVADVVTGQVDVREAAKHLPELDAATESINVLDDADDLTDDEPEADNGDAEHDD